ncbi:hypothetical protein EBQ90_01110 [bacterium]|nr:hypothetical protein [bacterium]
MKPSDSRFSASITPATLAALIAIQVTFASNYLFSKVVMQSVPPLVWGNIRTVCTALILMAALALRGQLRLDAAWKAKKALFLFSLLGVVLNQAAFLAGLQLTTTANSGLINTMIPIFHGALDHNHQTRTVLSPALDRFFSRAFRSPDLTRFTSLFFFLGYLSGRFVNSIQCTLL